MMKKSILNKMLFGVFLASNVSFAQSNLLNAKSANEIGQISLEESWAASEPPQPYEYVNERDVIFEKKVWEIIPSDQKINLQYFLPLEAGTEFKPLFDVLMDGIRSGEITEVYDYYDFTKRLNPEELEKKFTRTVISDAGVEQYNLGLPIDDQYKVTYRLKSSDVQSYKIMGVWYFDRNQGELKYRLLAICPVVTDIATMDSDTQQYVDLFWVFFPDARKQLYKNYAYNPKNLRMKSSFDYLLNARRFNATIYQTDNIFGDNYQISDYVKENAMFQLLEAERVKEDIREFEDDLWSY